MSSPVDVSVKATSSVEFVAGVSTKSPDSCIMTASDPSIVVVSLKVETGDPGAGAGAGAGPADEAGAGAGALLERGGEGG